MTDWLGIRGEVVIAIGGSSNIDRNIVESLLVQEVYVANSDISASKTQHKYLFFVKVDIISQAEVEAGVAQVVEKFGTVDGLVSNVGINIPRLLMDKNHPHGPYELSGEVFDKIVAISQKGLYLVNQAVGRVLAQRQVGVIINMSSEAGLEDSEGQSAYAAMKAAVNNYTRSWAKELGKSNVRVVGIVPGVMGEAGLCALAYEEALAYTQNISVEQLRAGYSKTSTIPLGRSEKLRGAADSVRHYLSDRLSHIVGITISVAGGKTRG